MSNVINGSAEELPSGGSLHPLQRAFIEDAGLQSGYCAPGQICSAVGMAAEVRRGVPSHVTADRSAEPIELGRDELRERMSGNLCRDFFGEKALFPVGPAPSRCRPVRR